jgi:hypothetical protein
LAEPPTLNDHRPDWCTRRCVTCKARWPCIVAQALLLALHPDAPRALRDCLEDLVRRALEIRADDADQLREQVIGWAFRTWSG